MPLVPNTPLTPYNVPIEKAKAKLAEVQEQVGNDAVTPEVAACYTQEGEAYFEAEEYFDALKSFKRALGVYLGHFQTEAGCKVDVAKAYINVGQTFVEMERYGRARENFANALDIYKAVYGTHASHDNIAMAYTCLAEGLRRESKLEEALQYNEAALAMIVDMYGENDTNELKAKVTYSHGLTLLDQCKYRAALDTFKTSHHNFKHVFGEYFLSNPQALNIKDHARLFLSFGRVKQELGCYPAAKMQYVRANGACKTFWNDDEETSNVFYAEIFDQVGNLSLLSGGTKDSQVDFGEAYALRCEYFNDELFHAPIAKSYILFGHHHKARFELELAQEHYEHALDIYKNAYSVDPSFQHPNIARCYNFIGEMEMMRARYKVALERHFDALDIFKKFFGESAKHPDIARTLRLVSAAYYAMADYDSAHAYNSSSLTMNKKLHCGTSHMTIAENYYDFGLTFFGQGELHQALEYFTKAHKVVDSLVPGGTNLPLSIEIFLKISQVHSKRQEMERALTASVKAIDMSQALYARRPYNPVIAKCFKQIADVYFAGNECDDAINNYSKADSIYDEFHNHEEMTQQGNRHPGKAMVKVAMAMSAIKEEEYTTANSLLRDAKTLLMMTYPLYEDIPARAEINKLQGDAYVLLVEPKLACEKYREALKIYERIYGKETKHPRIGECCHALAVQLGALSHYDESLSLHKRSVHILEHVHQGMKHLDLAESYNGLARAFLSKEDAVSALENFKKELEMKQAIFSPNAHLSVAVAECFTSLGNFFDSQKKFTEAVDHHQKALKIYQELDDQTSVAMTLDDVGILHMHMEKWEEAINFHQTALDIKGAEFQKEHPFEIEGKGKRPMKEKAATFRGTNSESIKHKHYPEIAISYCYLGNVHLAMASSPKLGDPEDASRREQYDHAYRCYNEALIKLVFVHGENHHADIADVRSNLGLVLQSEAMQVEGSPHRDNCEEALNHHRLALKMRHELFGNEPHPTIAFSYHQIGKCYHNRGEFDTAITNFNRALTDYKVLFADETHHIFIANVYSSLGNTFYETEAFVDALECYQHAFDITWALKDTLPKESVALSLAYKNLGNVHEKLGDVSKGRKAKEAAQKLMDGPAKTGDKSSNCEIM